MSQTVARAIDIVGFISSAPRTLGEVAEHLDVHKSTALRLLQTLDEGGFTRHLPNGKYSIGFGLIALAQQSMDQIEIRSIAHPHLQNLAEQFGHTVHLGQYMDDQVVYVDKVEGRGTVAMGSRIGLTAEAHTAGVAKVVLAYLDEAARDRAFKKVTFRRYTPTTILTPTALNTELDLTRERGWAEDDGEKEDYINCVALPIFDSRGTAGFGMSVTTLRAVAPLDQLRDRIPEFRQVALAISRELGWKGNEYGQR